MREEGEGYPRRNAAASLKLDSVPETELRGLMLSAA